MPKLNVLIEESASVDWLFYKTIRKFVDVTRTYIFDKDLAGAVTRLGENVDELTHIIDTHEKRLDTEFENISKAI